MSAQSSFPVTVLGASIPRSGHHFLVEILSAYYGDDLHYCSVYNVPGCCGRVPCTARRGRRVSLQKSHDFDFLLPPDLPEAVYLVQHRHPVPETLSDLELHVRRREKQNREPETRSRERLIALLARKALYYKFFHDKWIAPARERRVALDYDALAQSPVEAVRAVLAAIDPVPVEADRLAAAVERSAGRRGGGRQAYRPRIIERSPFFDRELFGAFESLVLDLCPAYGYPRLLEAVDYRAHPIFAEFVDHPYEVALGADVTTRLQVFPKGCAPRQIVPRARPRPPLLARLRRALVRTARNV